MAKKRRLEIRRGTLVQATPESAYRAAKPMLFDVWERSHGVSFDEALVEVEKRVDEEKVETLLKGLTAELLMCQECKSRLQNDWKRWSDA